MSAMLPTNRTSGNIVQRIHNHKGCRQDLSVSRSHSYRIIKKK